MTYSSLEHYESDRESEQFQGIVDSLAAIADEVAEDPDHTFNLTMKKAEVPGLGLLHWQQILEEVHVRVTERQKVEGPQGVEIDCLYVQDDNGWKLADHDEAFKISTPRANSLRYGFYVIHRRGEGYVQLADQGKTLGKDEIQRAYDLAVNFVPHVPQILAS